MSIAHRTIIDLLPCFYFFSATLIYNNEIEINSKGREEIKGISFSYI